MPKRLKKLKFIGLLKGLSEHRAFGTVSSPCFLPVPTFTALLPFLC